MLLSSEIVPGNDTEKQEESNKHALTYLNTVTALEREEKTQATLLHVIDREKRRIKTFALPIKELQEKNAVLERQIQEMKVKCERIEAKKRIYDGEIRRMKGKLDSIRANRTKERKKLLNTFSDQQMFLTHFEKEEEAKRELVGEKEKAESLLALEYEMELKYGRR